MLKHLERVQIIKSGLFRTLSMFFILFSLSNLHNLYFMFYSIFRALRSQVSSGNWQSPVGFGRSQFWHLLLFLQKQRPLFKGCTLPFCPVCRRRHRSSRSGGLVRVLGCSPRTQSHRGWRRKWFPGEERCKFHLATWLLSVTRAPPPGFGFVNIAAPSANCIFQFFDGTKCKIYFGQ